jgi:hypothetical protein
MMETHQVGDRGEQVNFLQDQIAGFGMNPGMRVFKFQQVEAVIQRKCADIMQYTGHHQFPELALGQAHLLADSISEIAHLHVMLPDCGAHQVDYA